MDENLKPVFDEVYKTQIEPYLEDIEKRRVKMLEEFKEKAIAYFSIAVIIVFVLPIDGSIKAFILFFVFPLKQMGNSIAGQYGQSIFQNRQKISFSVHGRGVLVY